MIIDELVLHDFGLFRGRHAITLTPPSPEQPVILFGGLNGAGKTTILDAIQLCLFGPLARCSSRDRLAYDAFLLNTIHRAPGVSEAAVELSFRHRADGVDEHYRVRRQWKRTPKGCREQLEVLRNHNFDAVATENWAEQAEAFLPARIAHLFLFDGEKVEAYADPRSASALIETAVYSLLGLDLVEKLSADLQVVERRRRLEVQDATTREGYETIEVERAQTSERIREAHQLVASSETRLGRLRAQREKLEDRYRKEGGHLAEQRQAIAEEERRAARDFAEAEDTIREAAAGAMPFLLVIPILERLGLQSKREAAGNSAKLIEKILESRDAELLVTAKKANAGDELLSALSAFLASDRISRRDAGVPALHNLSETGRATLDSLIHEELPNLSSRIGALRVSLDEARTKADGATSRLAAVPAPDALAKLISELDALGAAEAALVAEHRVESAEYERLHREFDRCSVALDRLLKERAEVDQEREDLERVLHHSARVRDTLEKFRMAMMKRHLSRIETLILDSFRQLLRKKTLVTKLTIDPNTFTLNLEGRDGQSLTPDRLSAGERQLLAVSILWGLSRASGRPIPTIIDTPLGRLDSSHRRRLIANYFPQASHQVVLLSTDEEINAKYLDALRPFVGRSYHLVYDEGLGKTRVDDGYFVQELEHAD